jgi:nucleoside-diphosphate-sugar epimerase
MKKILILGAAGFLGGHLEHRMKAEGHYVVSVARKHPPYRKSVADEFNILDLTNSPEFHSHFFRHHFDEVYQLASIGGGISFIADRNHDATILRESIQINLHTLEAIRKFGNVGKVFFASSQCVYPDLGIDPFAQERIVPNACREQDADFRNYAFAKEKLYAEALYQAYAVNHGIDVRIARFGNTYGPYCEWRDPRSKAVASICRKIAQAPYAGPVDLWGDGKATRSFTYVDDAIEGMIRLMASGYQDPVNIASAEQVSIADLFGIICETAGKILAWQPTPGPVGVTHRASDNTLCRRVLDWEPHTTLWEGLSMTYPWVAEQALTRLDA